MKLNPKRPEKDVPFKFKFNAEAAFARIDREAENLKGGVVYPTGIWRDEPISEHNNPFSTKEELDEYRKKYMQQLTPEHKKALELVKAKWATHGACRTCGWHAPLGEYGYPESEIVAQMIIEKDHVDLPCLNPEAEDHRGVRIYGETK